MVKDGKMSWREIRTITLRKANRIGHILRRNCRLRQIIKGKTENGRKYEEEGLSRYWIALRKQKILEFGRRSIRSHGLENTFWKRLWSCLKTGYLMVMVMMTFLINI